MNAEHDQTEQLRRLSAENDNFKHYLKHLLREANDHDAQVATLQTRIEELEAQLYAIGPARVPDFTHVAQSKLDGLLQDGHRLTGYAFERTREDGTVQRGFITHGGLVGWWYPPDTLPKETTT